ncbi:T9SS C-terminal target domain-containing protein [Polaribacter sp. WD7]|uniref:T9SS type A sorting domain-containing protein n=1 Tax=Polaribacter sp. WD7 TaxID=2269061 RepID=UPI000DF3CE27|nr:T9SS type A sorting domain-containing protein [Polaribacter sp. WD7]RCS26114.1 T9SS C-terminal target domain-containing protein [Polaribacter sp. WD7]
MKTKLRFKKAILKCILFFTFFSGLLSLNAQIVISEIKAPGSVELKNIGKETVDVSSYWLCDFPAYSQLSSSSINVVNGSLSLAPNAIVEISGFNFISGDDGELGLYSNNSFGSTASIVDYIEWGATGHRRASVAIEAGTWTSENFIPAFDESNSIQYDGVGNTAADYFEAASTLNAENCTAVAGDITINTANLSATTSVSDDLKSATICIDQVTDLISVDVASGSVGANRGFIITDRATNRILGLPAAGPFDLSGAGAGVCDIWYVRYDTPFTGNVVGNLLSDLNGCFDLSNPITITRAIPNAGTISLDADATKSANVTTAVEGNRAIICLDDPLVAAPVHVTKSDFETNLSYRYVITDSDASNTILGITNTNEIDLTGAGAGTCRIWGWSYRGTPENGAGFVGKPLAELEAVNCSDITDNWVTVVRAEANAGTISLDADATKSANVTTAVEGNRAIICLDDPLVAAPVHVTKSDFETNLSYRYVITDSDASNTILGITNTNEIDLTGAGAGTCRIWGWSYRGTPENGAGFVGKPLAELEAVNCSDITDNWVTVVRAEANAGTISLDADATKSANVTTAVEGNRAIICLDDPLVAAPVHVTKSDFETNLSYRYVITDSDASNTILGITNTNEIDLTGAGAGTCRIWGWSYRGTPENGAGFVGKPLAELEAVNCSDITDNWVTVVRAEANAGTISLDVPATESSNSNITIDGNTVSICIDNGPVPVHVTKSDFETNLSYRYVITDSDASNTILGITNTNEIDLTGAGEGTCRIWGWSYRGTPENGAGFLGKPLAELEAVNCSDITNNWINVNRLSGGDCNVLSTAEFTNDLSVSLYPNPLVNNLNVSFSNLNSVGNISLNVYNVLGKRVLSEKVVSSNTSIDISRLNQGIYLVRIVDDKGGVLFSKKVLK